MEQRRELNPRMAMFLSGIRTWVTWNSRRFLCTNCLLLQSNLSELSIELSETFLKHTWKQVKNSI